MAEISTRPRIVYVFTSSLALRFLRGQFGYLRKAGYDVFIISSSGNDLKEVGELEGVHTITIPLAREISPTKDLMSLWYLWRAMRKLRPCITNVGTPKAGLLGGLAAFLTGVPCRIYNLYGLRLETTHGVKRQMLAFAERLACFCAHRVICVSESLRQEAVGLGLVNFDHTTVFTPGSCNGVDVPRFNITQGVQNPGCQLREKLGIPLFAPVVGFVGRFTRDKGIKELLEAFNSLKGLFPELRLLLVGDFEEGDPPPPEVTQRIRTDTNIVCSGFVPDSAPYYQVMNVLALPTYREGFPNVVLEAGAAGKPAVVSNATGAVDSVIDGETGLIVPIRDTVALTGALAKLLSNPSLARTMGQTARKRVIAEFQQERIWSGLLDEYHSLLKARGLPLPVIPLQSAVNVQAGRAEVASS